MAKVAFTKLGLEKNTNVETFSWKDQTIEVKKYLPIEEKMNLFMTILNNCQDENNFINDAKLEMFFDLEVVFYYTNISFTAKQKENLPKLYDLLMGSEFLKKVYQKIDKDEINQLSVWLNKTAEHIYEYRNSIYGILDAINTDYKDLKLDAESIQEKIGDKENVEFLNEVLTKLG